MATEDDDVGTDDSGSQSPLSAVLLNSNSGYTTARAHDIAEEIYSGFKESRKAENATEDDYYKRLEQTAGDAKRILGAAKDFVQKRRYNNARTLLDASAALGKPTRSGSFGESMSNLSSALSEDATAREKFGEKNFADTFDIDKAMNTADQALVSARLSGIQKRRQADQALAIEALKTLSKEIRPPGSGPGSKSMSPFGKIALDEGLQPGTPEFTARVQWLYNADMQQKRAAAGLDVENETPEQKKNLADMLGVPYQVSDPFANLSTKGKQAALESRQKEAEEYLATVRAANTNARQAIQDLDRFNELNKSVATGPLNKWWPGTFLSGAGQEMRAITARQSRNLRVPGEGPMSNYDARQLTAAAVSTGNDPVVNRNIAKGMKGMKQLQLEYSKFINDYFVAHHHIVGADQAWQNYVENNPIFDPDAPGAFKLNKKRLDYKQYFTIQNGITSDPDFASMSPEEQVQATTPAKADGGYIKGYAEGGKTESNRGVYRNKLAEIQRALEQGATMNFGDELNASLSDDPYETAIGRERGLLENFHRNDPVLSTTAEIAGALPGSMATVYGGRKLLERVGRSRSKAGKAAAMLASIIPKNRYAQLSLAGAASGALAGEGAAQEGNDASSAGSGAVVGALAGPLGGVVTKYGARAGRAVMDFIKGSALSPADQKLVEAVFADNKDLAQMATQVVKDNKAGIPSTLADVGGRNVQALRDNIAARSGAGPDRLLDATAQRMQGSADRVGDRLNKALKPDEYFSKLDELKDALYTQAKPLYQQAYAENPAVKSDFLMEMANTKDGQRAIKGAIRIMRNSGADIGKKDAMGMVRKPNLEFFDRVKQSLDDMIRSEEKDGPTSLGKSLRDMRGRLMTELDDPTKVTDTYRKAREQYAGDLEVLDALKTGREDFLHMSSNEFKEATKDMSFAEKDALRTGVAESLFTRLENTATESNPAKRVIGTAGLQTKLRQLFDTDKEYNDFVNGLSRESQMFDQGKKTLAAGLSARTQDIGDHSKPVQDLLVSGGLTAASPGGIEILAQPGWVARMGNMLSRATNPMSQDTVDSLADTLHSSDPILINRAKQDLQRSLQRMIKRAQSDRRRTLEGALVTGDLVPPSPYGYSSGEEDDGYAVGGSVLDSGVLSDLMSGMPGIPSPSDGALNRLPVPSTASPPLGGPPGTTYGTNTLRSRNDPSGIDWEHYGETGPEFNFFKDNAVPDARYTTYKPATPQASGSAAGSGSSASGIASLIGTLANVPKVVSTAKDIGSLLGIGSTGAGAAALPNGITAIAAPDLAGLTAGVPSAVGSELAASGLGETAAAPVADAAAGAGATAGSSVAGLLGTAGILAGIGYGFAGQPDYGYSLTDKGKLDDQGFLYGDNSPWKIKTGSGEGDYLSPVLNAEGNSYTDPTGKTYVIPKSAYRPSKYAASDLTESLQGLTGNFWTKNTIQDMYNNLKGQGAQLPDFATFAQSLSDMLSPSLQYHGH